MIKRKSPGKIFFGWWTVAVTGILTGLGMGLYAYAVSALFTPIASELNFSRATTAVATGIGRLEGGIEGPISGWLVDRFGPRYVIFVGICIAAAGLIAMNFITSFWTYCLVWGFIIGTGMNLGLTIPIDKMLANWFISKRGLAQGIRFALFGIVSAIIIPLVTWQVAEHGWRITCLTWAGILFIGAPFALMFVKQKRPEYYGLLPDGVKVEPSSEASIDNMINRGIEYASSLQEVEFTLRQALRTPAYWMISLTYCCQTLVNGAFIIHCIPFLSDIGISQTAAGSMMGLMVFFTIPSRFLSGFMVDRTEKNRMPFLLAVALFLQAAGIGAFCLNQSIATVYVMLILFGIGNGATTPVYLVILGRYFGRKAYGSIYGSVSLLRSPVQLAAPIYAGWVYDTTGSYINAFMALTVTGIIAAIIMILVRTPKAPAHVTDISQFI